MGRIACQSWVDTVKPTERSISAIRHCSQPRPVLPGVIERPSERAAHIRQLGDGKTTAPYGRLER